MATQRTAATLIANFLEYDPQEWVEDLLESVPTLDEAWQQDANVTIGASGAGYDLKAFGETAANYWMWDASADGVRLSGTNVSWHLGAHSNTAGSGFDMANATAAARVHADDGGDATVTGNRRAFLTRLLLTKDSAGGVSYRSIVGQVKINSGIDLTSTNSVLAGVMGYLEFAGDSTQNGQVAAGEFTVETSGDITIGSSGWVAGVAARLNAATGKSIDAESSAFLVDTTGDAGDAWPYGLYIGGDTADTGIYINDITTGIDFTGAITTSGINFSNATYPVASDNVSLINIGTYDTGISIGATTDNTFAVMNNLVSTADSAYWMFNAYNKISMTTADQTSKSFCNLGIRQNIAKPVSATYGIQSHLSFSGTGDVSSEIIALSAQIAGTAGSGTGYYWGVKSDLRATNTPTGTQTSAAFFGVATVSAFSLFYGEVLATKTVSAGLNLHAAGNMTSGIRLAGCGNITNALEFDAASGCIVSDTSNLPGSATHKIKCKVGATTFYLIGVADF